MQPSISGGRKNEDAPANIFFALNLGFLLGAGAAGLGENLLSVAWFSIAMFIMAYIWPSFFGSPRLILYTGLGAVLGNLYYFFVLNIDGESIIPDFLAPLRDVLGSLKDKFNSVITHALPRDPGALLSGITFGGRELFSPELKQSMINSGTVHITAVSGYNISILGWSISQSLRGILNRQLIFWITVGVIIIFSLMVGAEPSVVRAAIMGILLIIAGQAGRVYDMRNAMASAAVIMAVHSPKIIIFDLGFQLSFLSLIGIVYFAPILKQALNITPDKYGILNWRENLISTAAAQCMVIPLLIAKFGQFSTTSIMANAIILEIVPLLMFLGFLIVLFGLVSGTLSMLIGWFTLIPLKFALFIISIFGDMPLSIHVPQSMSWIIISLYYPLLFVVYQKLKTRYAKTR